MVRPVGLSPVRQFTAPEQLNQPQAGHATSASSQPQHVPLALSANAGASAKRKREDAERKGRQAVDNKTRVDPASVDPDELRRIRDAVAAEGIDIAAATQNDLYKVARMMNRRDEHEWTDDALQVFAGINRGNASKIRRKEMPASPRTAAVELRIEQDDALRATLGKLSNPADRFRAMLDYNARNAAGFNNASMARAVGMNTSDVSRVLQERQPLTQPVLDIRSQVLRTFPPMQHLRDIFAKNQLRIAQGLPSWTEENMIAAAGVRKDNARKVIREILFGEGVHPIDKSSRRTSQSSERRTVVQPSRPSSNDRGMVNPNSVDPQEVADIRTAVAADGLDIESATQVDRYRAALRLNTARGATWSDSAMQVFANINQSNASRIRRGDMPSSPNTQAVKDRIEQDAELKLLLDRIPAPANKFRAMLDYNEQHQTEFRPPSIARAVGMRSTDVSRILKSRQTLTLEALAIQNQVPSCRPPARYFRSIFAENQRRLSVGLPGWSERNMIAASGVRTDKARSIISELSTNAAVGQGAPSIKIEEGSMAGIVPRLREVQLDMSRTAFYPEIGDLTGERVSWTTHFDDKTRVIVHDMKPNPAMDNIFQIRDPGNPEKPHPAYADPSGNIGRSKVAKATIGRGFISHLRSVAKDERAKPAAERRLDMSDAQVRRAIDLLQADVQRELERTLRQEPDRRNLYAPRELTAQDVLPHETPLIGQHGLFMNPRLTAAERPLFSNGKILGIYAGARLETQDELDSNIATYGKEEFDRYSLDTSINAVTFSPLGGANSMAFGNTALDPDSDGPAYDHRRLNTTFIPFSVEMQDREGKNRKEAVLALVAFDNLNDQVLVDYGDGYLDQFAKSKSPAIKQEPESDVEMPDAR